MKRAMAVVAVLGLVVSMGFAASNEVTSVNIVGYNVDLVPGTNSFNLVAVQFDAFDPTLLGVFGTNQLTAGGFPQQADLVYIFDGSGYKVYGLKPDGQFYDSNLFFDPSGVTNPPVPAGSAMWIQSAQLPPNAPAKTVTIAGEAVPDAAVTNVIGAGFQLMGYPFSTEIGINDMALKNLGTASTFPNFADRLYVWNGNGYTLYGLKDENGDGTVKNWWDTNEWFNPTASATADSIPLGTGFWYESQAGFIWVEANPYLGAFN